MGNVYYVFEVVSDIQTAYENACISMQDIEVILFLALLINNKFEYLLIDVLLHLYIVYNIRWQVG